jgi:AraC-like DNA-binding protein
MIDHLHRRMLFRSPLLTVADVRCRPHCADCGAEEEAPGYQIVFPRRGAFLKRRTTKDAILADPTLLLFFNRNETFRVAHPVAGGDDCTVITFEDNALATFLREQDAVVAGSPLFATSFAPTSSAMMLGLHALRRELRGSATPSQLAIEEASVQLLAKASAYAPTQAPPQGKRTRPETHKANRDLVQRARVFLAANLRERMTLDAIARAVFSSPFHLARVFRQETGRSLHAQLNQLRLRDALDQIADGARDLTALALELGFSSHSHFTHAFRREFGRTPSELRG